MTFFNLGFRYVNNLNNVVNCYHSVMDRLSEAHFLMLAEHIEVIQKNIYFGCKRLNWNSLGTEAAIPFSSDFCTLVF